FQGAGLPDILAIAPVSGRLVGIEVKRPKVGRLTELQKSQLARIEAAGGVAGVATSVEEALSILQRGNLT
ncbi:VRR-NUC domain-containing protein, partial [Eubacteriales bacterium OttesenSCG-928-N13]|nr:VRR-NUC domain-containing protein [Eubacteriales bacterium OttesenSCG-928-N13]